MKYCQCLPQLSEVIKDHSMSAVLYGNIQPLSNPVAQIFPNVLDCLSERIQRQRDAPKDHGILWRARSYAWWPGFLKSSPAYWQRVSWTAIREEMPWRSPAHRRPQLLDDREKRREEKGTPAPKPAFSTNWKVTPGIISCLKHKMAQLWAALYNQRRRRLG